MPEARSINFELYRQIIEREIQVVLGLRSVGVEVLFIRPQNEDVYKFRIRVGEYENFILITGREVRMNTVAGVQAIMERRIIDVAERLRSLLMGGFEWGGTVESAPANTATEQQRRMRTPNIDEEDEIGVRRFFNDFRFWRNDTDGTIREGGLVQGKDVGGAKGMECMRMVKGKLVCATIV